MAGGTTKKVIKAMSLFGGVQVTNILCSLVRAKIIAVWIGPVGVGLFGIYNSVIDSVSNLTQLNLRQSSVRDISQCSEAELPRMATTVRWWALRLGLAGIAVMLLLSPALSYFSFSGMSHFWAFAVLAAVMLLMSVNQGEQALLQGSGRLKTLAKASMWGPVCGTAISVPLLYFFGVKGVVPTIIFFALASLTASWVCSRSIKCATVPTAEIKAQGRKFLQLGVYLTITALASPGATYVFLSYLNTVADTAQVGIYQAGYTLSVRYVDLVFAALAMEYYPRLSRIAHNASATSKVVSHELSVILCVLLPLVIVFISADELMVRILYDAKFLAVVPMITISICGAMLRATSYCMSFVIVARGDGRTYVVTETVSALIGLALNITAYHFWGLIGIGVSYVVWYAAYTLIVGSVYVIKYGMGISTKAMGIFAMSVITVGIAYCLKMLAWWAPLPLLLVALMIAVMAKRMGVSHARRRL